ncbi:MAG TPA: hypothetical protein VG817_09550 [Gemmatimonadales bacterium]|nr:hypothetical protein [Gemmatimonadales bacterium]
MNRWIPAAALAAFVAFAGCSNPNDIADASLSNEVDTVTIYSQTYGSVSQPSAYSITSRAPVRTWEAGINFEFVFDVDADNRPVLLPVELFNVLPEGAFQPGLRRPAASTTFSEMTKAPLNGYITEDTIPVAAGDLFFVRTTVSYCSILRVPLYAKLHVIAIDTAAKTLQMEVVANQNCGYRSLTLGIPKS